MGDGNRYMGKRIIQDDSRKTKAQLLDKVQELREQVGMLESIVSKHAGVEREHQATKKKLKVLFEQSGTCCMILDPNTSDGIPVIVDANKAACETHGYTRAEFIGRPITDVDNEVGRRKCIERTQQMLSGKPLRIENTHIRKNGTMFSVAVYANQVEIEGELPLIITSEHDITDRKCLEEELREKSRIEGIYDMVVTYNHEMNQPLTVILGGAQMMLQHAEEGSEIHGDAKLVEEASLMLSNIVQKISNLRKTRSIRTKEYQPGVNMIDID
jgi:two-component system, cell cycle sensor histidine kinase and response regulator CckA